MQKGNTSVGIVFMALIAVLKRQLYWEKNQDYKSYLPSNEDSILW